MADSPLKNEVSHVMIRLARLPETIFIDTLPSALFILTDC